MAQRKKTGGRVKGTLNKNTAAIKEMIEAALTEAGGVDYLVAQSEKNPVAFMGLVGKVLPMQVTGAGEDGSHLHKIVREFVSTPHPNG